MTGVDIVTAVANVAIALFAGIALFVAIRQIHISREVSSLSAYESYHLACLQYPDFATGLRACDPAKRDCYLTFVLFALMTGERVLKLFPKDETWIYAVKDDIRLHRDIIASDYFRGYREHQDLAIRQLIDEVLAELATRTTGDLSDPALPPAAEVAATPAAGSISSRG